MIGPEKAAYRGGCRILPEPPEGAICHEGRYHDHPASPAPGSVVDPLTEIAREGARQMLMAALKAESASFVAQFGEGLLSDGRQRVVRHGAGPERMIQAGIGPIAVQRQKVRDRAADVPAEKKIRFSSNILPRWARRSHSLDALLPVLYLRGVSTGDFQEALTALLGAEAPNLSPGVISRLTAGWQEDYDRWQHRGHTPHRLQTTLTPAQEVLAGTALPGIVAADGTWRAAGNDRRCMGRRAVRLDAVACPIRWLRRVEQARLWVKINTCG